MVKVFIWNDSQQKLGGGFTFIRNLIIGARDFDTCFVLEQSEADVIFIAGSTMVAKTDEILGFKGKKKIILRVDNAVRDSRNRGCGMGKLKRLAEMADVVVYQSKWAKEYLHDFLGKPRFAIIYNGVDTSIFNPDGDKMYFGDYSKIYLYSRYNRDETKSWEVAWYDYQMIQRADERAKLVIVGKFSDEQVMYNFDFFNGETIEYLGVIDDPYKMAQVYRGCDVLLAPYFNDCYSNTMVEALACGLELQVNDTGGNKELLENGVITLYDMFSKYFELFNN
jgi:glycosyltransferase involved in cell wall biosynthesis